MLGSDEDETRSGDMKHPNAKEGRRWCADFNSAPADLEMSESGNRAFGDRPPDRVSRFEAADDR